MWGGGRGSLLTLLRQSKVLYHIGSGSVDGRGRVRGEGRGGWRKERLTTSESKPLSELYSTLYVN